MPTKLEYRPKTVREARARRRYLINLLPAEKQKLVVAVEETAMKLLKVPASKYFGVRCTPDKQARQITTLIWRVHPNLRLTNAWIAEYYNVLVDSTQSYHSGAVAVLKERENEFYAAMHLVCQQFALDAYQLPRAVN